MFQQEPEVFDFEHGMRSIDQEGFKIAPTSPMKVEILFILLFSYLNRRSFLCVGPKGNF